MGGDFKSPPRFLELCDFTSSGSTSVLEVYEPGTREHEELGAQDDRSLTWECEIQELPSSPPIGDLVAASLPLEGCSRFTTPNPNDYHESSSRGV